MLALQPKLLSLGNINKNKFFLPFHSFNRNFAH